MTFRFDADAALARIRGERAGPATPATETGAEGETVATVAVADAPDMDAFAERAAIAEHDGGLARDAAERMAAEAQGFAAAHELYAAVCARWTAGLEGLQPDAEGRRRVARALRFIREGWAAQALALDWRELALVGADARAPWRRLDRLGAAYLDYECLAVTAESITFAPALRHYRSCQADGAVLPWDV